MNKYEEKWDQLPGDMRLALLNDLAGFMTQTGEWEKLGELLTSYCYLRDKTRFNGIYSLLDDFRTIPDATMTEMGFASLQNALALGSASIAADVSQLPIQLLARLSGSQKEEHKRLLNDTRTDEEKKESWLLPLSASLRQATNNIRQQFRADQQSISQVLLTGDESHLVTAGPYEVKIWRLPFDGNFKAFEVKTRAGMALSKSETDVIVICEDGSLLAAGVQTGRARPCGKVALVDREHIEQLAILNSDEGILLSNNGLRIFNLNNGIIVHQIDQVLLRSFQLLTDGQHLVTASVEGRWDLIHIQTGRRIRTIGFYGGYKEKEMSEDEFTMRLFGFTPMVMTLPNEIKALNFVDMVDKFPEITNAEKINLKQRLQTDPLKDAIEQMLVTPDGQILISASLDGKIICHDLIKLKELHVIESGDTVQSMHWDQRENTLVTADKNGIVKAWHIDPESAMLLWQQEQAPLCAVIPYSDHKYIVAASDGQVTIGTVEGALPPDPGSGRAGVAALITGQPGQQFYSLTANGELTTVGMQSGARLSSRTIGENTQGFASLTPDSKRALFKGRPDELAIVDIQSGLTLQTIKLDANTMPFQPDSGEWQFGDAAADSGGRFLLAPVSAGFLRSMLGEGFLGLWDLETEQLKTILDKEAGSVSHARFSADGRYAAYIVHSSHPAHKDGQDAHTDTLLCYNVAAGSQELRIDGTAAFDWLSFAPDGEALYWETDGNIYWCTISGGGPHKILYSSNQGFDNGVHSAAGSLLLLRKRSAISVFDIVKKEMIACYYGDEVFQSMIFEESDSMLICGDEAGNIHQLRLCRGEGPYFNITKEAAQHGPTARQGRLTAPAPIPLSDTSPVETPWEQLGRARNFEILGNSRAAVELLLGIAKKCESGPSLKIHLASVIKQASPEHLEPLIKGWLEKQQLPPSMLRRFAELANAPAIWLFMLHNLNECRLVDEQRQPQANAAYEILALFREGYASYYEQVVKDKQLPFLIRVMAAQFESLDSPEMGCTSLRSLVRDSACPPREQLAALSGLKELMVASEWLEVASALTTAMRGLPSCQTALSSLIVQTCGQGGADLQSIAAFRCDWTDLGIIADAFELSRKALSLFFEFQDTKQAIACLDRAIRQLPREPVLYFNRGGIYSRLNRLDEAIADFSKAIELDGTYEKALSDRGYSFLLKGIYELALADLSKAIRLNPREPVNYKLRAQVYKVLNMEAAMNADTAMRDKLNATGAGDEGEMVISNRKRTNVKKSEPPGPLYALGKVLLDQLNSRQAVIAALYELLDLQRASPEMGGLTIDAIGYLGGAGEQLMQRFKNKQLPAALEGRAAELLLQENQDETLAQFLLERSLDPREHESQRADHLVALMPLRNGEYIRQFLYKLRDGNYQADGQPERGLSIALFILKEMGSQRNKAFFTMLVKDTALSGSLRELCGEIMGAFFDRSEAIRSLISLGNEQNTEKTVQKSILNALRHYGEEGEALRLALQRGLPAVPRESRRDEDDFVERFLNAASDEELEDLAWSAPEKPGSDDMVRLEDQVERWPDAREQQMHAYKLQVFKKIYESDKIRTLSAFVKINSEHEMKAAMPLYPLLANVRFRELLHSWADSLDDGGEKASFERRLQWLESNKPEEYQLAAQALFEAQTQEEVEAAAARNPIMKTTEFRDVITKNRDYTTHKAHLDQVLAWIPAGVTDSRERSFEEAGEHLVHGEFSEALSELDQYAALHPGKYNSVFRGVALAGLNRYEEAIAQFSIALERAEDAEVRKRRGACYFFMRKFVEALADYTKSLEINPRIAQTWIYRGQCYSTLGSVQKALADFDRAAQITDRDVMLYASRSELYANTGQFSLAAADLMTLINLSPPDPGLYYTLIYHQMLAADIEAARASTEQAKTLFTPDQFQLNGKLASALAKGQQIPPEEFLTDLFLNTASAEELAIIAEHHPVLRSAEFRGFLAELDVDSRFKKDHPRFDAQLGWLDELPPDTFPAAFDCFTKAENPEDMRQCLELYPLLRTRVILAELRRCAQTQSTPTANEYLSQRFDWLTALLTQIELNEK
jgi:tetratricopeptide (TPR) repeat protein/WD40 repeat protein